MSSYECIICSTQVSQYQTDNLIRMYSCSKCGVFKITEPMIVKLEAYKNNQFDNSLKNLPYITAERHVRGLPPFLLKGDDDDNTFIEEFVSFKLSELIDLYPKNPIELLNRCLLNLSQKVVFPFDNITIEDRINSFCFTDEIGKTKRIIAQLCELGYTYCPNESMYSFTIQAKGWEKIEELQKQSSNSENIAFVAMWFSKDMEKYFENGFKKAIEVDNKYAAKRIDFVEHNNKICDEIIATIRKSKFLVADFSGNRGGVYYEAGFAHGLGIPVIWTVHEDHLNELHFDTRQFNHIVYKNFDELYTKLRNRINATIV